MPPNQTDPASSNLRSRLNARFQGPLMAFFTRRIKNRAEAEDLTQETLLRVFNAQAFDLVENPESYVFSVATNLLRDHRRLSLRFDPSARVLIEEAVASELEHQLVEDSSPEKVLLNEDYLKEVLQALDQLGERTRDIFILFRLENMKQKDIAALYGIGQSTVEKHVMKAVAYLTAWRERNRPL